MSIPKIIHQTYKEKIHNHIEFSKNWIKYHKEWKYIFYEDKDIDTFLNNYNKNIEKDFNGLLTFLNTCSKIEKIDIFRYLLMYYIGGIYCDIDTNCYQSFDKLCKNQECIFGIESYITHYKKKLLKYKFNYTIGNAILISKSKHPIFKDILDNIIYEKYKNIIDKTESEHIVQKTGPGIVTKTIQDHLHSNIYNNCIIRNFLYKNKKIKIMEQIFFYPPTYPAIYNFFPFNINIYCNHICDGSWKYKKKNNYSTMDFLPYPWIWMYKYRIDYFMSIISMLPLINTVIILYKQYKLKNLLIFISFLSATIYHTNEYLGNERIEMYHIIDNVTANNIIPILSILKKFKNNIFYNNLITILFTIITYIYQYNVYSNTFLEIIYIIPFIFYLKEYFLKYIYLSLMALSFFYIGSKEFDYFSSRKYHTLWHISASLIVYYITQDIIN